MSAKYRQRQIDLYGMDLVWLIAKQYYKMEMPRPSEVENEHRKEKQTAKEIKEHLLQRLGR